MKMSLLHLVLSGYIQAVKVTQQGNNVKKIKIEAKAYRSQSKTELPYHQRIKTEDNDIKDQHCSCKAG